MKPTFLLSLILVSFFCLQVKASIYVDKTMVQNGKTFNINYCLPNDFDKTKAYPLIVAMHYCGGTAKQYRDALSGLCDSMKMIVVCPDNGSQVIPETRPDMLTIAIDSSKIFYPIDTTKIYLTGMSCNGEFITRWGLNNYYHVKGIFPWDPWIVTSSPKLYNYDCKIPFVISVGSLDPNFKTLIAVYDSLKAHKATVNLVIVPNVGHELPVGLSNEMVNCIYFINGTPDFSFEPIPDISLANTDSVLIDVVVNNPGNKDLIYSATVSNKEIVKKVELKPGDTKNHLTLKVVPALKRYGNQIITVKAFDKTSKLLAEGFSTILIQKVTSAEQIKPSEFKIYPVPVTDYLFFTCKDQNISVQISDVSGKEMMNFENVDTRNGILLQSLPKGFYLLNAKGINTEETIKFLKE